MRGQGEGSIFPRTVKGKRADGTPYQRTVWTAQVTLDDGRKIQRAGPGKAEARAALAELQRHQSAETINGSRLTLRAYLEGWLADVRPNLAPATWRKHEQHIRNHLNPAFGGVRLSDLSVGHVRRYLVSQPSLHGQTLRHHRATLRRALADAVRDGLVARNVAALAEPPKLDTKERPVLTAEQARTLIEGTREHRYHALWTLLVTTGLREAEALALTWKDMEGVDLGEVRRDGNAHRPTGADPASCGPTHVADVRDVRGVGVAAGGRTGQGQRGSVKDGLGADRRDASGRDVVAVAAHVRVHRTLHRIPGVKLPNGKRGKGSWEFRTTKTAKSRRTVFLPAVTVEALREHRRRQMERWLAAGKPGDGQMVFTDTKGRPVHGSKLTEILYPLLDELGLPRVSVHDLRHSAATVLYGAGVPLEAIADMLGHSTTRVTSDLYRHRVETVQRDAADAMERAVG